MPLTPERKKLLTDDLEQVETEVKNLNLGADFPEDPEQYEESYAEAADKREDDWKSLLDQKSELDNVMKSPSFTDLTKDKQEKIQSELEQNRKKIAKLEEEYVKDPTRKVIESAQYQKYRVLYERREAITNELNGRVASPKSEPIKITLASSLPLSPAPSKPPVNEKPAPSWTGSSFESFPSVLKQQRNKGWLNDFLQKYKLTHGLGSTDDKVLLHNNTKDINVTVNPTSMEFTSRSGNVDEMAEMVGDLYVKVLEGKPRIDNHIIHASDDVRDKVMLKMAQKLQENGLVDENTMINDQLAQDILNNAPSEGPNVTLNQPAEKFLNPMTPSPSGRGLG